MTRTADSVSAPNPSKTNDNVINNELHDLISIAEIEAALSSFKPSSTTTEDDSFGIRLPFLLRCLAALQSRSDVMPYLEEMETQTSRLNLNSIARLLEDVAAAMSGAENVEDLVALAPSLCGDTIGKIPQLPRMKRDVFGYDGIVETVGGGGYTWSTKGLSDALDHLAQIDVRLNKRSNDNGDFLGKRQKLDDDSMYDSDDEDILPPTQSLIGTDKDAPTIPGGNSYTFHQTTFAANDSYESAMRRTLQELISLVKSSLDSGHGLDGMNQGEDDKAMNDSSNLKEATSIQTPLLTLKSESLLAETNPASASFGGACSSLSVMIVTLMHHAPALRHDHVAAALCRAAVPQAHSLIKHMAANCPSSIHCLLRGVIDAFKLAERHMYLKPDASNTLTDGIDSLESGAAVSDIVRTTKESIKSIASLSRNTAYTVIRVLRNRSVMDDLVLELMLMENDIVAGASFIVKKLSTVSSTEVVTSPKQRRSFLRRQSSSFDEHKSRPVSLRQRMLCSRHKTGDITNSAQTQTSSVNGHSYSQTALQSSLSNSHSLIELCMKCFLERIASTEASGMSLGEAALLLRAFTLLVYCTGIFDLKWGDQMIDHMITLIGTKTTEADLPEESTTDEIYKMLICATLIFIPISQNEMADSKEPTKPCKECLKLLLLNPKSIECVVFSSRMAGFVLSNDAESLGSVIFGHIYAGGHSLQRGSHKDELKQTANAIDCVSSIIGSDQLRQVQRKALTLSITVCNPAAAIDAIRGSDAAVSKDLDELIKSLLWDSKSCGNMFFNPMICDLIRESVNMLLRRDGPHIPLVLPLSLEQNATSLPWSSSDTPEFQELFSQFVLKFVYALYFLDEEPKSPFVIDPRSFPLKEVLCFIRGSSPNHGVKKHTSIFNVLNKLISKHCPDVIHHVNNIRLLSSDSSTISGIKITPSALSQSIRDCISDGTSDSSGIRAEQMYHMARSCNPIDTLVATVCSAVLSPKHSQPKYFSYVHLCKDPLVIFKAPASAWKCDGVRRLVLKTLYHLMRANESMAMESSKTSQVAQEYLASRDAIILRCLLFTQTNFLAPTNCVLSLNMIRSIIACSPGITTTLLKQGLDDEMIDYLCEFVPESFSDAPKLSTILSSKESLSAPERLVLADASLRIAIAHSCRGEQIAKGLFSLSLSVLMESFQFVLGPVGVPVSVIRGQVEGQDTTEICRVAMFRMLGALSTVDPDSSLKSPGVAAIARIASMCKSESSSVGSGAVGARRKALLKEIWDACSVANTALGGEIQL